MTDFISSVSLPTNVPNIPANEEYYKTKEAVQDFEAYFLTQSFEQMYNTVPVNETFGGGNGEKIFRSMLLAEYGKMTAENGGIGITNQILAQMVASQKISAPVEG